MQVHAISENSTRVRNGFCQLVITDKWTVAKRSDCKTPLKWILCGIGLSIASRGGQMQDIELVGKRGPIARSNWMQEPRGRETGNISKYPKNAG